MITVSSKNEILTCVLTDGRLRMVVWDPSNVGRTRFTADIDQDAILALFGYLAKDLALGSSEAVDIILEVLTEHPELLDADPALLEKVLSKDSSTLQAFVESSLGHVQIKNLSYRSQQLQHMRDLLWTEGYFESQIAAEKASRGLQRYGPEDLWQDFFEENRWIFGLGLDYRFGEAAFSNRLEQVIQGASATEEGHRVDAVLRTRGTISAVCLVEIKHHRTSLVSFNREYRSGVWQPSKEMTGAVSQSQTAVEVAVTNTGFTLDGVSKVRPASVVVAGQLDQFLSDSGDVITDKFRSFELFRRQLAAPTILTFDELFDRAQASLIQDQEDEP